MTLLFLPRRLFALAPLALACALPGRSDMGPDRCPSQQDDRFAARLTRPAAGPTRRRACCSQSLKRWALR